MFDRTSRYASLGKRLHTTTDGREVAYVERRFLPRGDRLPLLVEVIVEQSDRLDLIASRTLDRPELFWHICDANDAMDPFELITPTGRRLRVPLPQP